MKKSLKEKESLIQDALTYVISKKGEGISIAESSRVLGIPKANIFYWLRKYGRGNMPATNPKVDFVNLSTILNIQESIQKELPIIQQSATPQIELSLPNGILLKIF